MEEHLVLWVWQGVGSDTLDKVKCLHGLTRFIGCDREGCGEGTTPPIGLCSYGYVVFSEGG